MSRLDLVRRPEPLLALRAGTALRAGNAVQRILLIAGIGFHGTESPPKGAKFVQENPGADNRSEKSSRYKKNHPSRIKAGSEANARLERQVRPEGFEPSTLGSEDRCAIQLRHGRVMQAPKEPSVLPNSTIEESF